MASRAGLLGVLLVAVFLAVGAASGQPAAGTAMYAVRVDPRLCPSPLCGGYWVALANGARTLCADGTRRPRCYVARAEAINRPAQQVSLPQGALARARLRSADHGTLGRLGVLAVAAVYAPAGSAPISGGYYRVVDAGIRCVRAPCFSYRATQVNGSTRTTMSSIDLAASGATPAELGRAEAALGTKNGLYARGRFARSADGGTVFRAFRLYLRAPLPRA
jgi:hypothetical protein